MASCPVAGESAKSSSNSAGSGVDQCPVKSSGQGSQDDINPANMVSGLVHWNLAILARVTRGQASKWSQTGVHISYNPLNIYACL